jgi:hypothetical protein
LRDAGGPPIWIDGGTSKVWILDSTIVQSGEDDTVLIADTISAAMQDIKITGNHIESSQKFAIRLTSAVLLNRVQITDNLLLGWVSMTGATKSQIQDNQVHVTLAEISDPVIDIAGSTHIQIQNNLVHQSSGCAIGYMTKVSSSARVQVQKNEWFQEVTGVGLVHLIDSSALQLQGNNSRVTNAGSSTVDAYLIEASASAVDNIQITGENITADSGTWNRAIRVLSSGQAFGVIHVVPGVLDDCATGVLFDDGGGGADRFTGLLMVAGGIIDATTKAWDATASGVYIRIAGNASPFGPNVIAGNGSPESTVTAGIGSIHHRLDGGTSTTLYVKESGTGNTGWVAK